MAGAIWLSLPYFLVGAKAQFSSKVIDEWCNRIAAHEAGWANYFRENHIEPLILFYKDVVASHQAAAERILEFLAVPFPPDLEIARPTVQKQATQISEEWTAAYLKLKGRRRASLRKSFDASELEYPSLRVDRDVC